MHYAIGLRHEAEKIQLCSYPQRPHNLEREPASLTKIPPPPGNCCNQSTYNVQGRQTRKEEPKVA